MLNEVGGDEDRRHLRALLQHVKNEYPQLGGHYEVVHHTQLLNRLVREKRLVPVARPADVPGTSSARNAASTARP